MARESRVKKSLLNARVNLICYFVSLLVAFFTRKVFLEQLGTEFIGLTGTLQSLLGFLNLAELGVGTAIGYVLYKPIFDDDRFKINEIISVFGYLYRCIGLFILGAGVVLSFFLPLIFPDTSFSLLVIYFGFYAYLAASMLGYFVNYRQTLLSADQRNYEVTGYYQAVTSAKMILQMVLAIYVQSFMLFLAIELIFGIIYSFVLTARINKVYPWLKSDVILGKQIFKKYPEIGKYIKLIFVHKIGNFSQMQLMPILVYAFNSLTIVGIYGNYILIISKLQGFVCGVFDSVAASVGNLVSEGNRQKIYDSFLEIFVLRFYISGVLACCLYLLVSSLITIWLGSQYILADKVVLLMAIHFFLVLSRGTTEHFLTGYGLFSDIFAPIVEIVLILVVSVAFGSLWGLIGVLSGPVVAAIIISHIWKPYFLYTRGFKVKINKYWWLLLKHLFAFAVGLALAHICYASISRHIVIKNQWMQWIVSASACLFLNSLFTFIAIYYASSGMRRVVIRFLCKFNK